MDDILKPLGILFCIANFLNATMIKNKKVLEWYTLNPLFYSFTLTQYPFGSVAVVDFGCVAELAQMWTLL